MLGQGEREATVKVKGITLHYTTSKLINFVKISNMILTPCVLVPVITTTNRCTDDHQVVTRIETKLYKLNPTK